MRDLIFVLLGVAAALFFIYRALRELKRRSPKKPKKREYPDGDLLNWEYQKQKDKDEQLK